MDKLISIVVPTKNRYDYLVYLINLLASFHDNCFEMIIQDNSDDNTAFLKTLKNYSYDWIKYYYDSHAIPISENATRAILNSTGEYVCFIGDDDGVTRLIFECVRWMKKEDISILKSSLAIYKWESFSCPWYYNVKSSVLYSNYSQIVQIKSCEEVLVSLLKSGIDSLVSMPKVYNGIVKRSVLNRVYEHCQTFFPGPSPDMANAVALALEEDKYAILDAPIIIGGHSSHLGGDVSRYKRKYGPLEEQPFIAQKDIDAWDSRIPKIWAARTVWPESAISALKAYKSDYLSIIDFRKIHRKFVVDNPSLSEMVYSKLESRWPLCIGVFFDRVIRRVHGAFSVLKFHLLKQYSGLRVKSGIKDIIAAEGFLFGLMTDFNPHYQANN